MVQIKKYQNFSKRNVKMYQNTIIAKSKNARSVKNYKK